MFQLYAVFIIGFFIYLASQRKPKNFPPGPWGIPILGHLPLLGLEPYKTVVGWKEKYGPIIGVDFASFSGVIISDYKLIKEAMNEAAFSGRPKLPLFIDRSNGHAEGLLFTEGRKSQEQRRFTQRYLRDFGYGTKSMESIIQHEIIELIEKIKHEVGHPISTSARFSASVINALWTIISGERFELDDPKFNEVIKALTIRMNETNHFAMLSGFIPWIAKYVPDFISRHSEILQIYEPTKKFLQPYFDSHFQKHVQNQPKDFIDIYIDEIKKAEDPSSSFHKNKNGPTSLLFTVMDLFLAGTETTTTTLTFICLYLSRYTQVQERLVNEIRNVVGPSQLPSLSHRPDMPYTEAVIHEVMRVTTLTPMSLMHSTTQDVEFHGYHLPKDTIVIINLHEVHNNVELWGDPANFRPERFLSKDESKFKRHEGFVPFSLGKRVCLGESLARDQLFLFTSSIFQAFHVSIDPSCPPPSLDPVPGMLATPQRHKLIFNLRKN